MTAAAVNCAAEAAHQLVGLAIGFFDPLDDPLGLGRIFQLDRNRFDRPVPGALISRRYGSNGTTPRPGGRSPCTLPSQSDKCTCPTRPSSRRISSGGTSRQHQVRDVEIGHHVGQPDVVQKSDHRVDVVHAATAETARARARSPGSSSAASRPKLRTASTPSRHCSAGGITSRFQIYSPITSKHVAGLVLVGQVEIGLHALDVKLAHAGVEIDQAHGHAGQRDDRQSQRDRTRP